MKPRRLSARDSVLLVVDVQEKLLPAMPDPVGLVRDIGFLLDVANLLDVPALATEQYPQGLGPTTPEIARRLRSDRPAKLAFSACGAPGALEWVRASGRPNVVVVGMEAHVCVLHTVLDLLGEGFAAFVPVDAVSSRWAQDRDAALCRLERTGAVLTTAEATAFEWMGGADHPQFRAVSGLVKARAAARS